MILTEWALNSLVPGDFTQGVKYTPGIIRYPLNRSTMIFRLSFADMFRRFLEKLSQNPEYYPIKHYKRMRRR